MGSLSGFSKRVERGAERKPQNAYSSKAGAPLATRGLPYSWAPAEADALSTHSSLVHSRTQVLLQVGSHGRMFRLHVPDRDHHLRNSVYRVLPGDLAIRLVAGSRLADNDRIIG